MNAANKIENARLEIAKGEAALEEARILLANGKYDGAVSRSYYAVFHYASAALMSKGLEARSHIGMQRLFHLHFIRTKIFSEEMGIILSHTQKAREEANYYPEISFSEKTARDQIQEIEKFVDCTEDFLKQAGVLT